MALTSDNKKISDNLNKDLLKFLKSSPTPFHAVENLSGELKKKGYKELKEADKWSLKKGGKYFVKRNGSSLVAFKLAKGDKVKSGFRMIGAHTDSPALKVKPFPDKTFKNYFQLGVEIYGGVLLAPWFDRDLSLAGKINYTNNKGQIKDKLIDFKRAIGVVPNLAIHLDRTANEKKSINKEKELAPLLLTIESDKNTSFENLLKKELKKQKLDEDIEKVHGHDLFFYDTQEPSFVGINKDFIASARLDNLFSCYIGMKSFIEASDHISSILVCNDHEEVGSCSHTGAAGPMLKSIIERIVGTGENFTRSIENSMLISCDNAHALHPNYPEKHENHHAPLINHGPVIKINSNQRYASYGETTGIFAHLCEKNNIPYQKFVIRQDMGCGSTIGPITSTALGVKTLDIGVPTFAMHSIRELAGSHDAYYLFSSLVAFLKEKKSF